MKYLMNPHTGSVDTEQNWLAEISDWDCEEVSVGEQFNSLIEVCLADGAEVPANFDPSKSDSYVWVEV